MQIKVTDTKMHRTIGKYLPVDKDVPVAEGKLILIQAKEDSLLAFNQYNGEYYILPEKGARLKMPAQYLKPIIISETEKIEVGDWYLHYNSGTKEYTLFRADSIFENGNNPNDIDSRGNILPYGNKKVLALPEHFSPKILNQIVNGELKDGDGVLLECEEIA
jgi:hypothetical protein